jgi:transglutaminase-like putative cysteine protease
MITPPMLLGAALLFWGWENGHPLVGAALAAIVEAARIAQARWDFSDKDLYRISDLCWALVVGVALLLYSMSDHLLFVFKLAQWFPVCFLPLILAQLYGNRPTMPFSVFWWLLRRDPDSPAARKSCNISYGYFTVCVMGVSASTQSDRYFYPGIALLIAWALTAGRSRRISHVLWVALLAAAIAAGEVSHTELRSVQTAVETMLSTWLTDLFRPAPDTRELQTRIGYSGRLVQSGKIMLRLRVEPGALAPSLLRETTWDAYRQGVWTGSNNDFVVPRLGYEDSWLFLPTNALSNQVEISLYYDNDTGVLPLPHGTFEVEDIPEAVKTNRLGVAIIENPPGLLDLRASFGPGRSFDAPPCDRDLMVDKDEAPVLARIVTELGLDKMTEQQKIRAIDHFFATRFRYSLTLPNRRARHSVTYLGYFLTRSHIGHCEYFATATVLLLRQAGIPARYVTGYAVPVTAKHGDTYLVRSRDAHAWALVYHNDTKIWEQLDTTPGGREAVQGMAPPWWEPETDALSNFYFQFSKWRWSRTSWARYSIWLLVPTILYLAGRILFGQRRQRSKFGDEQEEPWPGGDSELYLINRRLAAAQLSRLPNEPLLSWQQRLEQAFPDSIRLRRIFHLHRCLRFDPQGLKAHERETLRAEAQRWLEEFNALAELQKRNAHSAPLPAPE